MVKVALTGGAYTAHSVIASAQRCVNLFPEPMPSGNQYTGTTGQGEPMPAAHYPTPGTRLLGNIGSGPIRGVRQCTTGGTYVVSGSTVYSVDTSTWTGTSLGTITTGLRTPVSMDDNGLDMFIVDGTVNGWTVNLAGNTMTAVSDPGGQFAGADRVDYLDTFFIFNKPNTPQFYISLSLSKDFDSLAQDAANKEAYSDLLVVAVVAKRLIYLFGTRTTEVWYDAGTTFSTTDPTAATSFQFAAMQSEVFIDHGCAAKYSPAVYDNSVFWLTRDRQGQGIVMMVSGYQTKRVSTYAIEAEIAGYDRISDAIGFCYQLAGHTFYVLTFPHADKTWSYDIATGLWHQWVWIDSNGDEHRHRANCFWPVNDTLVVGDWQNGNLYALDNRVFTDNGSPIKRTRAFPHILNDGKRVFYRQFLADFETGWAPEMIAGSDTRLWAQFTAANGTNLSAYTSEVGGGWTAIGPAAAQIVGDKVVGLGGDALYQSAAAIFTPNYTIHFDVVPPVAGSVVAANTVWAIGRASGANTGYRVAVAADGMQYTLTLAVLPSGASASVPMGTIASGFFTVWLLLRGTNITAQAQRSVDGRWLRTDGTWQVDPGTIAAQFTDATYALPGAIMIGGTWPAPPPPGALTATFETENPADPNYPIPPGYSYYATLYGYGFQTFDFSRNIYYALIIESGPGIGIAITNLSTMTVTTTATLATMYAGTPFTPPAGSNSVWDIVTGNNTDIYLLVSPSKTAQYFVRVDANTLKVTGQVSGFAGHDLLDSVANKTTNHTIVGYKTHPAYHVGLFLMDGTGMAAIGYAATPVYTSYNTTFIPAAAHANGSCDFIMIDSNLETNGLINIWRINVSDSLMITSTMTGTFDANTVYTPGHDIFTATIGPINYDAANDAIIFWLQNDINGPPTWLASVSWDGSVNWSTYLDIGTPASLAPRGQAQLTGNTLMTGSYNVPLVIDTTNGSVIYTGALSGPFSRYYFEVWDATRNSWWIYGLAGQGFTRIDLPIPPQVLLAIDNVIATATPLQLEENLISLKWSDDRGHAWGSPVTQDIGEAGEYRTSLQWQRLGMARDRCFEISWSVPMRTALQGCWVDVTPAQS